jgi:hypothetical protein
MMHARLRSLFVRGVAGIRLKGRHVVFEPRRITPAIKRAGDIAFRHPHRIFRGDVDAGKAQETAFASAEGFDTAAIAFSGLIRKGNETAAPATAPIWRKRRRERNTSATSENTGFALRLAMSSRCSF